MPEHDVRVAAVILAGGSGTRVGAGINKVLLPIAGEAVLLRSVLTALEVGTVERVVVVCGRDEQAEVQRLLTPHLGEREVWLLDGGAERHDSEWNALAALSDDIDAGLIDIVAIHDGARPLATSDLWRRTIEAAIEHGAAIPVVPATDLVDAAGHAPRVSLGAVQTPQAFRAAPLLQAHRRAHDAGARTTDTAACLERFGDGSVQVVAVPSDATNVKITWAEDLRRAESVLARR